MVEGAWTTSNQEKNQAKEDQKRATTTCDLARYSRGRTMGQTMGCYNLLFNTTSKT